MTRGAINSAQILEPRFEPIDGMHVQSRVDKVFE